MTASGRAGGRAGVKVDCAPTEAMREPTSRPRRNSCIVTEVDREGIERKKSSTISPGACYLSVEHETEQRKAPVSYSAAKVGKGEADGAKIDGVFTGMPGTFL